MKDMMSPSASPDGIFVDQGKLGVTRINKRIVGIAMILFGGAALILMVTISARGPASGKQNSAVVSKQKVASASPPSLRDKDADGGGNSLAASSGAATSETRPLPDDAQTAKEELQFQREIRRHEHQQEMQRLARRDASFAAPMEIKGGGIMDSPAQNQPQDMQNQEYPEQSLAGRGDQVTGSGLLDPSKDPNLQKRKESFFNQQIASNYLPYKKQAPLSPYEVKQGTVIPGIMVSGINSDLPGQIIGQVSQNVHDSVTGQNLLIPQGTKIIGSYDSFVAVGQEGAMIAWRRLVFPDGMAIDLLNMAGADQGGYAGFRDQVNNHYLKIFGSATLLSLVGAGYQISQPQRDGQFPSNQDILAAEVGRQYAQVSNEMIRRNMQIQPTIEIRPGYRFNIMVNKDMILEPYAIQ
ncbi:MAG: hypothetical protein M3Q07_04760 [Pseudobdellovibrionaceae bacterium]|nr:hypothetical protein [Pseudobdellovibrionaceae bacterium]